MKAVIDTNVVFEGLTKHGGACGLIVDAWLADLFQPCVSTALAYEYDDVLARKLSDAHWSVIKPVLGQMLAQARFVSIFFSWRPISPDPGDDLVIDCAMNAGAPVVTKNTRDFRLAQQSLGLSVLTPAEFVMRLGRDQRSAL
jgi:predicted nucleic acid-binding protein